MSPFSDSLAHPLIVVLGPTASGKTKLAVELARTIGGEILSADSRQVYRGLDLGAGKDLAEYGTVPYHLIDICNLGDEYNAFRFQRDFWQAYEQVVARGAMPILCGGTGFYLEAVLSGYQFVEVPPNPELRARLASLNLDEMTAELLALKPELHNTTDLLVRARVERALEIAHGEQQSEASRVDYPKPQALVFGIDWPREQLRARIRARLRQRLDEGLIEEVAGLRRQGVSDALLDGLGLEYRFVGQYVRGELNRNDMFQQLASAICQFAKRQDTWFRRMARHGITIHWLNPAQPLLPQAMAILER